MKMEDTSGECISRYMKGKRVKPSNVDRLRIHVSALFETHGVVCADSYKVYRTVRRPKVPPQYTYVHAECEDTDVYLETYQVPRIPSDIHVSYYIEEIYMESGSKVFYRPDLNGFSFYNNIILLPCNVQYLVLTDVRIEHVDERMEHVDRRMVPVISVLYIHPGISYEQVDIAKQTALNPPLTSLSTSRNYRRVASSPR